jgi:hypothetical protein
MEYKKNLASVLQRKEHFKKILMHIKELNTREGDSEDDSGRVQKVIQSDKEAAKAKP